MKPVEYVGCVCVCVCVIQNVTKPGSNGSLIVAIKPTAKCRLHMMVLFSILYK
jgi:hypothetical protein